MDDLHCIISSLAVPTSLLTSDILRDILIKIKKNTRSCNDDFLELYKRILEALWTHLQSKLQKFDDQLLCSTCFYAVLSALDNQEEFLHLISQIVDEELSKRKKSKEENDSTMKTVSIIYGIFQSNLIPLQGNQYLDIFKDIFKSSLNLLIHMAYEYSHYTFIIFKILASIKKVVGTNLQHTVFTRDNQLRLLNMVNHNWENPINGVKNLNKSILQTLISIGDDDIYVEISEEINTFYWNKAKYLMFTEIIEQYNGNIDIPLKKYNLVEGLLHSLHKPGLVSAGADLYYSVLKKIKSEDEWAALFLNEIKYVLNNSSRRAIENFNNYWCLTTFKAFPSLSPLIINTLQASERSEKNKFSMLCLIRQSNKLNLIENYIEMRAFEKLILHGIEHCNPYIRMAAFDIVCVSYGKFWPDNIKYDAVLNYLSDNVNSDFTVLRLSMLNSLRNFLSHLQTMHLNSTTIAEKDVENLFLFCVQLQNLLISSLEINGNYQRKITTIKIACIAFNSFIAIPRKKHKQMKQTHYTLMEFIIERGQWILFSEKVVQNLINVLSDPADDVRQNVLELLLNYYSTMLKQPLIMNQIVDLAIIKISSKFFYEINCGKSMFELIIKVLMKEDGLEGIRFKNIEEIFNFAYNELLIEHRLKRDIVESIEKGKQLHSYICILCAIFESVRKGSYKLQMDKNIIWSLLQILEDTSSQFIWEEGVAISSDFSKMSDMVLKLIDKSGYAREEDEAKITGLQQIVLNCLWLNVKESCNLVSLMIQYYKCDMDLDVCQKSLYVFTKALETSRHKGVIEAAGIALGESIQTLTSLPECQLSSQPSLLLDQKLKEFISEANNMASVTRRGAGLSIMVHRIVSNDMQTNKPLFHHFLNTLLNCCKMLQDDPRCLSNVHNKKDLPKAIYIHFLTRIVTDSSLTTEVMYYSAKLVELAFENIISSHWQIRNAALQLYGALVPKLIGQKKDSGSEDEVTATVACDEFRTHFPQLWIFILNQLKQDNEKGNLQFHSNLLPILNILGNMAKRYNFSNDLKHMLITDNDLLKHLTLLLGSPIFTVRRLTAKCIFNMYTFDNIFELLLKYEKLSENFLHGCLLLLVNCYNHYRGIIYKDKFDILIDKFKAVMQDSNHSYPCMELIESVASDGAYEFSEIQLTLIKINAQINGPGKFQWANANIHKFLLNCQWNIIPQCLPLILENSDYEKHCKVLYKRLISEYNLDNKVLREIIKILTSFLRMKCSSEVWKILYKISLLVDCDKYFNIEEISTRNDNILYKSRFILPLLARITSNTDRLLVLCNQIHKLCNADLTDVDMRIIAATANNEMANKLSTFSDEVKIISIINAVILLQDEDEDVRNLSVYFYKNASKNVSKVHSHICLRRILDGNFLKSVLCDYKSCVKSICDRLLNFYSSVGSSDSDLFNPFANKCKNIYQEIEIVNQLISKLKDSDLE